MMKMIIMEMITRIMENVITKIKGSIMEMITRMRMTGREIF